ncbi:MAG: ATP synthase subunit I [Deltaproteobacteria bacterium]|nr:ATP synthase subunit I [Deltaproteobacteria bacterium]
MNDNTPPLKPAFFTAESMRTYYIVLTIVGAASLAVGYMWQGLDFMWAVLLGFLIVAANLIWTKNLVKSILISKQRPTGLVIASYVIKFVLTAVVLYAAIIEYQMDAFGVLIGLTALLGATFLFAFYGMSQQPPDEEGPQ